MIIKVKSMEKTQLIDITTQVQDKIRSSGTDSGLCMVFVPHTTAAVTINENADPSVKDDIEMVLNKIIPWNDCYQHMEGNSAAHVKSTIVGASELISIENNKLLLGTWQGILFCEFDGPRNRNVYINIV